MSVFTGRKSTAAFTEIKKEKMPIYSFEILYLAASTVEKFIIHATDVCDENEILYVLNENISEGFRIAGIKNWLSYRMTEIIEFKEPRI